MHKLSIFSSFINLVKLQNKRAPGNNPCIKRIPITSKIQPPRGKMPETRKLSLDRVHGPKEKIPDPRGKKSFPTTLSRTEDFPELYNKKRSDKMVKRIYQS